MLIGRAAASSVGLQAVRRRRRDRVRAACRAAARLTRGPFVRTARRADARRDEADRLPAADRAWRANDFVDAAPRGSRFNARRVARERFGETAPL
jgi:hypothetical protein